MGGAEREKARLPQVFVLEFGMQKMRLSENEQRVSSEFIHLEELREI